jgi:iron complex transport system ATP-binding protein
MIRIESAQVRMGSKVIVKPCSLSLKPSQLTVILGPNGAGKSTLLKMMAGEYSQLDTQIFYENSPLQQWSIHKRAVHRSVLSQHWHLPFPYKVHEVIKMARPKLSNNIMLDFCRILGLIPLLQQLYPTLSGGEKQRVQLAKALCQLSSVEPKRSVLLLDEPLSAQDLHYQLTIMRLLKAQAQSGQTLVAIMHDLQWASLFADQAILMKAGQIHHMGPTHSVLTPHKLEPIFDTPLLSVQHPTTQQPYPVTAV